MRVALFIDGKNFYAGWKDKAGGKRINFSDLADWVAQRVGGTSLWGAHYYTGVDVGPSGSTEGQVKLNSFLDMLEMQPGFFVERFPRRIQTVTCTDCGCENRLSQEKDVDTTMVADMIRLAAIGAFDILVLMSGDGDYAPAIQGVRAMGKQAWVATWGGSGLSSRIRRVAFDHIDLLDGLASFERFEESIPPPGRVPGEALSQPRSDSFRLSELPDAYDSEPVREENCTVFLAELRKAEEKFYGGYVGANYFVTRWASDLLHLSPGSRRRLLDALVEDGRIELYDASDGNKAIRVTE